VRILIVTIFLLSIFFIPSHVQAQSNSTLLLQTIEIPHPEFNKLGRNAVIVDLEMIHTISWQVTISNDLLYANPNGNAVVRLYDATIPDKFIEVGMGSPPDEKYWIAVQIPGSDYVLVHSKPERGWIPGVVSILAFSEKAGLTVNNGERIVLSNLDLEGFQIGSYSVFGMESSNDPPATASGSLTLEFMSGDPTQSALSLFPFFLAGGIGAVVAILLVTKKRS